MLPQHTLRQGRPIVSIFRQVEHLHLMHFELNLEALCNRNFSNTEPRRPTFLALFRRHCSLILIYLKLFLLMTYCCLPREMLIGPQRIILPAWNCKRKKRNTKPNNFIISFLNNGNFLATELNNPNIYMYCE